MHVVISSLKTKLFLILSLMNISVGMTFIDPTHYLLVICYYLAILLNQSLLIVVVGDMTSMFENKSIMPTWLMAAAKLIILLTGVLVAVHYLPTKVHIIMGIYIFQLIILVISTKRIVKKN